LWWWITEYVDLGLSMSGRLAITMSIQSGKLVKTPSGVTRFVFVGSKVSHSCRDVVGSWSRYCCCSWAIRRVIAANASGLVPVHAYVPMRFLV